MEPHRDRCVRRHAARRPTSHRPGPLQLVVLLRWSVSAPPAAGARPRREHQRRPHLGEPRAGQLPARRVRQDRARDLLRVVPRRSPRVDRRLDVEGGSVPPARTALHRADHHGVGIRRGGHGVPARSRIVVAVLHVVRRDDVGGHRTAQLPVDRHRAVRRCCLLLVDTVQPRADPRRHLARPVGRSRSTRATRSSSRCTASPTAASPAPDSAAATRGRCPRPRTTSSSPRSARNGA